jgi:glyoxylase-like metal-dependent hydrolase (beta-lactamase superfamily II)
MKVHSLNCGTMRPPVAPELVCHVLLLEAGSGLVLVDTGFGLSDIAQPGRLGPFRHVIRPALAERETAIRQVERLGFARDDVRHILLTHFDLDHIGGLADFPEASVHVTAAEAAGAMWSPSRQERVRYRSAQWAHGPRIVEHTPDGDRWRGFAAAKPLDEVAEGVVLIALPGHSRGHAAVAVQAGDRWLLHAGDAFFHRGTLDPQGNARIPAILRTHESLMAFDRSQVRDNHARLAELHGRGEPDLTIVNAHDPVLLDRVRAAGAG